MGNVNMEARQVHYRGGDKPMSVEDALKSTAGEAAAIAQLQTDVVNLSGAKANQITIAPFFSAEASYSVGDLVYYNGLSYRCTTDHSGEWNAEHFTVTTIALELANSGGGVVDYSTTEQETGVKWIDGKVIYKKTVDCGALPNSTSKLVSTGVTAETVIKLEAVAQASTGGVLPLPYVDDATKNADILLQFSKTSGEIRFLTGTDYSLYNAHATIFYTKSTT